MPNFLEAIREAEKQIAQEKQAQAKQTGYRITSFENVSDRKTQDPLYKQIKENEMDKFKIKKTHILVAVYVFLIIIELFFYVPYHNIQVFRSVQNVPHTEIIGNGYATMSDITKDNAYIKIDRKNHINGEYTASGKIVNSSQVFVNVSITTIVAVGLYLILQREEKNN